MRLRLLSIQVSEDQVMKLKMDKQLKRTLRSIAATIAIGVVSNDFPDSFVESLEQLIAEIRRQNS